MITTTTKIIALSAIIEKLKEKSFDINTQYKFIKISAAIKTEVSFIEEQQTLLLKQYAEKDELGKYVTNADGGFKIRDDAIQECGLKLIEINTRQVTLPDIYFSLDELEPLGLTLGDLELLEPFIK